MFRCLFPVLNPIHGIMEDDVKLHSELMPRVAPLMHVVASTQMCCDFCNALNSMDNDFVVYEYHMVQ